LTLTPLSFKALMAAWSRPLHGTAHNRAGPPHNSYVTTEIHQLDLDSPQLQGLDGSMVQATARHSTQQHNIEPDQSWAQPLLVNWIQGLTWGGLGLSQPQCTGKSLSQGETCSPCHQGDG
jgi:hypothetical protein